MKKIFAWALSSIMAAALFAGAPGSVTYAAEGKSSGALNAYLEGSCSTAENSDFCLDPTGEALDISQSDEGKAVASYTYTGRPIRPVVHLYDGNKTLNEKADFTVSYKNNKNPYTFGSSEPTSKTPVVICKLKGNYSGQIRLYFQIVPESLSENVLSVPAGVVYKSKDVNVVPELYFAGKRLKIGKDFQIKSVLKDGSDNKDFVAGKSVTVKGNGSYAVTVEGIGCFRDERTLTITASGSEVTPVSKVSLGTGQKTLKINGDPAISSNVTLPGLVVKAGSNTLNEKEYETSWILNGDGKTAYICAAAVSGKYSGGKAIKVKTETTDQGKPSGKLSVYVADSDPMTDDIQVPYEKGKTTGKVTVTYAEGGEIYLLREKTDYSLKYDNNTSLGKATVTATGTGSYKGLSEKCDFRIVKQTDPDSIFVDAADVLYKAGLTGEKVMKTKLTLTDRKGTKLIENTDYKLEGFYRSYTSGTFGDQIKNGDTLNAGDVVYVKLKMTGGYDFTACGVFHIYSKAVSTVKVTFADNGKGVYAPELKSYYYTGSEITPGYGNYAGTVLVDGKAELQSTRASAADGCYIDPASFQKNVNKGTGSFMLYGTGSIGGSKKVPFKIAQKPYNVERKSWDGGTGDETGESLSVKASGGALEAAYMEWLPYSGSAAVDGYNAYYRSSSDVTWTRADDMLIRGYSGTPGGTNVSYWRVDVPGLAAGTYFLKVVGTSQGQEQKVSAVSPALTVAPHDRSGFAFAGTQTPGAYKADGTLKDNAYVLYVTEENKDDVYVYVTNKDGIKEKKTGLQNILDAYSKGKETHPLDIRLIGCITRLKSASKAEINIKNNKDTGTGITLEGIGNDAVVNGASVSFSKATYAEIRNIAVMNSNSEEKDDITISGSQYVWVHNCDLFYGEPGKDDDQAKGDGAMDCVSSTYATFSYNHFWDTGKSILLGLNENNKSYEDNASFVTYHHNWFDHSDSRHPRTRFYNAHVYNNYYDGNAKYGMGACLACSIFSEGNYFRSATKPMLISLQGTDVCKGTESDGGKGSFSSEAGGMIKAYNNKMVGNNTYLPYGSKYYLVEGTEVRLTTLDTTKHFDAYEVENRNDTVPATVTSLVGGNYYSNFDTADGFYSYTADDPDRAKEKVLSSAGRLEHGDFSWEFDDSKDDKDSEVNTELKAALEAYKTCLVSVPADAYYEGVTESKDSEEEEWVADTVTITPAQMGIEAESVVNAEEVANFVKAEVNENGSVTLTSRSVCNKEQTIIVKGKEAGKTRAYIKIKSIANGVGGLGTPEVIKAEDFDPEGNKVTITSAELGLTAVSCTCDNNSCLEATVNEGGVVLKPLAESENTITVTVSDASSNTATIRLTIADTGKITYQVVPFRGTAILFFNTDNKKSEGDMMKAEADSSDVTVGAAAGTFYYRGTESQSQKVIYQTVARDDKTINNAVEWKTSEDVNYSYSGNENAFVLRFTVTPKKDITLTQVSSDVIVNQSGKFRMALSVDGTTVDCGYAGKGNNDLSFENETINMKLLARTEYTIEVCVKAKSSGASLGSTKLEVYMGDLVLKYS